MNKHEITPATTYAFAQSWEWLANVAHNNARAKLFWQKRDEIVACCKTFGLEKEATKLIDSQLRELIISEVSEACEGDRKDLMDDKIPAFTMVEAEMADAVIRIADYCAARKLRIGPAIIAKMAYNAGREPMHGKQF